MATYNIPSEWKPEGWWRNRPVDERLFHLHVPRRWRDTHFCDLTTPDTTADQIAEWLGGFSNGDCLYIHGRNGGGKTVIAQALVKYLVSTNKLSGRFLSSERYIDMLHDSFDNNNELPEMYSSRHLLKYIQGVFDILVLDGVGQERDTEFTRHEIGSLIRRRYEDGRSIIITTSFSQIDFVRRYGDRVKIAISEMPTLKVS